MESDWRSIIGSSLLVVGLLFSLCIAGVSLLQFQASTSSLGSSLVGIVVALVGFAILRTRRTPRARALASGSTERSAPNNSPNTLLGELLNQLGRLDPELLRLPGHELTQRIDQLRLEYIVPFMEAHEVLFLSLGKQQAALVLLSITNGNETLLRLHSSDTQRSPESIRHCYEQALNAFHKAYTQLGA